MACRATVASEGEFDTGLSAAEAALPLHMLEVVACRLHEYYLAYHVQHTSAHVTRRGARSEKKDSRAAWARDKHRYVEVIRIHNAWVQRANDMRGAPLQADLAEGYMHLSEEECLAPSFDGAFPFVASGATGTDGTGVPFAQRNLAVHIRAKLERLEEELTIVTMKVRNLYCVLAHRERHLRSTAAAATAEGQYGALTLSFACCAQTRV